MKLIPKCSYEWLKPNISTPKTAAAMTTINTSRPQMNHTACCSCLGVGWVMPKKLMNPRAIARSKPISYLLSLKNLYKEMLTMEEPI